MDKNPDQELIIYAIYDKKAEKYDTPFFAYNETFAKRRFLILSDEPKSQLATWPEDFELTQIGILNFITGEVESQKKDIIDGKAIHAYRRHNNQIKPEGN